jgi:hypothetical protein
MSLTYYGSRISENIVKTEEGYLICRNVPIGRIGEMRYLKSDLQLKGDGVVTVYRDADVVFDKTAMASFEGKPVTNDHPPEDVEAANYAAFAKGHAQNIRRGEGEDADKLIADLIITDPVLIAEIENGKREISCGYHAFYKTAPDGRTYQSKIRGNHIAVVMQGRAGDRVSIKDHQTERRFVMLTNIKKKTENKKFAGFLGLFARSVRDAKTNEEIEDAIEDAVLTMGDTFTVTDAAPAAEPEKEPAKGKDDAGEEFKFADAFTALNSTLAELRKDVDGLKTSVADAVSKTADASAEADPFEIALRELAGKTKDSADKDESKKSEDGEDGEDGKGGSEIVTDDDDADKDEGAMSEPVKDAAIAILRGARKAVIAIKDAKERKRVQDALLDAIKTAQTSNSSDVYKSVLDASTAAAKKKAAEGAAPEINIAEQQKIYDSWNPHKKVNS